MFYDILKFYKKSSNLKNLDNNETLENYLKKQNLSKFFINYHLIPMVSAIWSMPPQESGTMPLKFFLNFFQNHGLFKLKDRPQWYTVKNRSRTYVNKILSKISGEYYKNYKINKVKRESNSVKVYYGDRSEFFDYEKIVLAVHADDALSIIENPLKEESEILSNFNYKKNLAVIHTDESSMPKNKKVWSSWNSKIDQKDAKNNSVTYWLNLLQNLNINKNIFLTLNPFFKIDENKIIKKVHFTHPYFNQETLINQKKLNLIQNKKSILFCGSYFGYGFHEDGIKSSIEMVKHIND
jgi:predicted NAD/FAD-binding protein